ncbi:MAG: ribosome biogenesis GTPase Der [Chloroflexi bacterium]|nr:ribosome biogenesis GTPase Der [Chloroflexota bacterium]
MKHPIVAIVGRPNVGKSTLFNRIAGKRVAVVADLPGTTRDWLSAEVSWGKGSFTLLDTGGLELHPESTIKRKVKAQVERAIQEADLFVFMVDVADGLVPGDIDVADALRRTGKPVVLAVNKADTLGRNELATEFYRLGFGEPVTISAYHGRGTEDLMDHILSLLPPSPSGEKEMAMRVAVVGRPNVGKSTLLNTILGEERVIVDETPGTTRDAIDTALTFEDEPVVLIDTAGIRRPGRLKGGAEHYSVLRAFEAIDRADVAVLVMDATELVAAQDTHIAGYVRDSWKGLVLVINKWDLAKDSAPDEEETTEFVRRRLKFMPHVPVLFISAKHGWGVDRVLPLAKDVYRERYKRVPAAELNKVISIASASHPAPSAGGKHLVIFRVEQIDVNPPTFAFSVNNPKLVHFSYQRYLENRIREAFGFQGTPIRLLFKRGRL